MHDILACGPLYSQTALGVAQTRQHLPSYMGGQESAVPPEARDELAGDMSKDNEWLYAAAADPALYLKDV